MMRIPPVVMVNGALTVQPWVPPLRRGLWHGGLYLEDDAADSALVPSEIQALRGASPSYSQMFGAGWDSGHVWDFGAVNASVADAAGTTGGKALKTVYPAGSRDPGSGLLGGAGWRKSAISAEAACLRYKVRFSDGFAFGLGGKLPGLYGGTGNTGGNIPTGADGWSARFMWTSAGGLIVYAYLPTSVQYGTPFAVPGVALTPGQWHTIEQAVKLNTPGKSDGEIVVRVNGVHRLHQAGLRFRDVADLKANGLLFSTFFGGKTDDWNCPQDQFAEFADFEIFG